MYYLQSTASLACLLASTARTTTLFVTLPAINPEYRPPVAYPEKNRGRGGEGLASGKQGKS